MKYAIGQKFKFAPGDKVICNGYAGAAIRMYSEGMVEVRLARGSVCSSSSYPDCFPASLMDIKVVEGEICPECNGHKVESNGMREYRCVKCDHRFGAEAGVFYGFEFEGDIVRQAGKAIEAAYPWGYRSSESAP